MIHDAAGHRTKLTDANGNATDFKYDAAGNLAIMAYPNGDTEKYLYDGAGKMVKKVTPKGDEILYSYDAAGNLKDVKFGGTTVAYERDVLGQPTAIRDLAEGKKDAAYSLRYSYDLFGRLESATDDTLGQTIKYGYDNSGRKISMSACGHEVKYGYDAAGRLASVQQDSDKPHTVRKLVQDESGEKAGSTEPK